jgi:hypothetical protein
MMQPSESDGFRGVLRRIGASTLYGERCTESHVTFCHRRVGSGRDLEGRSGSQCGGIALRLTLSGNGRDRLESPSVGSTPAIPSVFWAFLSQKTRHGGQTGPAICVEPFSRNAMVVCYADASEAAYCRSASSHSSWTSMRRIRAG